MLSPNPTTQEVYEHIRAYFSRPDAVLAKFQSSCVYRDPDGNKCAVGCLISDELYDAPIEDEYNEYNQTLGDRIEENPVAEIVGLSQLHDLLNGDSPEGRKKLEFLTAAQKAHDTHAEDAADFVRALDLIARIHELHNIPSRFS